MQWSHAFNLVCEVAQSWRVFPCIWNQIVIFYSHCKILTISTLHKKESSLQVLIFLFERQLAKLSGPKSDISYLHMPNDGPL